MFKKEYLEIPFLRDFAVEELTQLLHYASAATYKPDETIFRQGDQGRELYVVTSGKIRFEFKKPDSPEVKVLSSAGRGTIFGEMAFLESQPRTATAVAEEAAEVLIFKRADVQKLIDLYPSLAVTFYHSVALELANRLRNANPRIT